MADPAAQLRRTPLHDVHLALGARLVAFAGWQLPLHYTSIHQEHLCVRQRVGLFDVSHMGKFIVSGTDAEPFLNFLLSNDVRRCPTGRAQYTLLLNEAGGILDDLMLYRLEPTRFLLVVNAANTAADFAWLQSHTCGSARLVDCNEEIAILALQGPLAWRLLPEVAGLNRFGVGAVDIAGCRCWAARTGYTGEDGFELFCAAAEARRLWDTMLARGAPYEIRPCGLGARDTLRLEACLPLHGQDITTDTTPLEAGLDRFVGWAKDEFVGRTALLAQRQRGVTRRLVAFRMNGGAPPPRPHYPIFAAGEPVGTVTSGAHSPTLGTGIGMGYVNSAVATPGTTVEIEVRGRRYAARIEQKPLYKRQS